MNIRTLASHPRRLAGLLFPSLALSASLACESAGEPAPAAAKAKPKLEAVDEAKPAAQAPISASSLLTKAKTQLAALPASVDSPSNPTTPEKVALGRALYHDARLSRDHDISCASCHVLDAYGVDGKPVSPGHQGQTGDRNSPTVYNAGLQFAQFWDGRAKDLEEQAVQPILNPVEMALNSEAEVVATVQSIPGYAALFEAAFPGEPVSFVTIGKAIAAFERTLATPAPFDAFLGGDLEALSAEQLRGLKIFLDAECTTCHTGPGVGGAMYQKLGSVKPYPTKDEGRAAVTSDPRDKGFFKVPMLRNVAKTGPYFHDGSIGTLREAVGIMIKHQTNHKPLTDVETDALLAFLDSLTGPLPGPEVIGAPELPPDGPETRKPGQVLP